MAMMILPMQAKKVEADKAEKLAQNFMQSKRQQLRAGTTATLSLKYTASNKNSMLKSSQSDEPDTVYYYVFNVDEANKGGFVIVAGDDVVKPVLGYSDKGSYDENNLPSNFAWWMEEYQREISYAQSHNLPQSESVKNEWESYLNGTVSTSTNSVAPLIQTHWDQGAPYNNLCPEIDGMSAPTGCTATAMAQIMKYWNYPASGRGKGGAYTTPSGINIPAVNFEVNYDWADMQNNYTDSETFQQQNAVATLMYQCGLSVQMQYNANESVAMNQDICYALMNNFGYDRNMQLIFRNGDGLNLPYGDSEWETMLKAEIDAGRPVFYAGQDTINNVGHAFVCDGYDNSGNFHFNWGWGMDDGYFATTILNPGGNVFSTGQCVITNMKPFYGGLSGLNVSAGTLSPTFYPYIFDYVLQVDASVSSIDIAGITGIPNAIVTGNVTNLPVKLNDYTDVSIQLTLPDSSIQTYKIAVFRGNIPDPSFTWKIDSAGQIYLYAGVTPCDTLYIDWGDKTDPDTITQNTFFVDQYYGNAISHIYNKGIYKVTIYGENESSTSPLLNFRRDGFFPVPTYFPTITQIDVRKALQLRCLEIPQNGITNLDVSRNTALEELDCSSNQLTTLNVDNNLALKLLWCQYNQLSDLDISKNAMLTYFDCGSNHLADLDVSKNISLRTIGCYLNQLKELDVSKNTALTFLDCQMNQFTNLDVSHNPALMTLRCGSNQLFNLDISKNIALLEFRCDNNQLSDLDVSKNTALTWLMCYNNQLTNLDISKNTALTSFICTANLLTNLDVSNNTALTNFECFNNALPLSNLYTLAQRTDITDKQLGQQTLPDSTISVNTSVAVDTVFFGVNTTCNYPLNNGKITFPVTGGYLVTLSNPAILDGSVQQTFHVVNNTGINNILQEKTLAAWMQNGTLHVSGLTAGKSWSVYDVSGKLVSQSIANSETADIPLFESGVYLVSSGTNTVKVINK